MVTLLDDGSVLVGGGFNQYGDVGCENPNIRRYSPSYLAKGSRPAYDPAVLDGVVKAGSQVSLDFTGAALHETKGVALLALQAFTHSYGQNQRYVRCRITNLDKRRVTFMVPEVPVVLPGYYRLFLVSDQGVPSVAATVRVPRDVHRHRDDRRHPWAAVGAVAGLLSGVGLVGGGLAWRRRQRWQRRWQTAPASAEAGDIQAQLLQQDASVEEEEGS